MGLLLALGTIDAVPRVVIPVGGMVVSTAMVTAGLALQRTVDVVGDQRPRIEARLALGLSAREAFLEPYRTAMRTALVPAVDTTKVVGLISLPGAMTGLILAGVDPWDAIRYQIVVMYMLLGAAFMAAVLSARLAQRSLFDDAERLVRLRD
jgi:putative ABC transport system permease protein